MLHIGIERRVYIQSPLIQLFAADMQGVDSQAADIVAEIRRSDDGILFSLWLEAQIFQPGGCCLGLGNIPHFRHGGQNNPLPFLGIVHMGVGGVVGRAFGDTGKNSTFRQIEISRCFAKIHL
ncbi:hypothetical protein D3C86_1656660 [compost metagenome]